MTITITGLPLQGTLLDTTNIPVETAGVTGHIAASTIKNYISASTLTSISVATGDVSGVLTAGSFSTGAIDCTTLHATGAVTIDGAVTFNAVGTTTFNGDVNTLSNISAGNLNISSVVGSVNTLGNVNAGNVNATATMTAANIVVTGNVSGSLKGNLWPSANIASNIGNSINWFNNLYSVNGTHSNLTVNNTILPGVTAVANIGSASLAFGNVFATNTVSSTYSVGTLIVPTANTSANIGSSALWFNTIFGTASHALYADLAEKYTSDQQYAPGTVLVFGEETEVTISMTANDTRVAGVVSTDPAYLMNGALENGVAVALQGRVPCKVIGVVKRGDLMVTSDSAGVAMTNNNPQIGSVIGKALGNHDGNGIGVIEVVVGRI